MDILKPMLQGVANVAPPEMKRPLRDLLRVKLLIQIFSLLQESAFNLPSGHACSRLSGYACGLASS
jgi:hypothetical protein